MADINLIPAAYLKRQFVQRHVRRFLIVAIAVAALVGAMRVALNRAIASETVTVTRLAKARNIEITE